MHAGLHGEAAAGSRDPGGAPCWRGHEKRQEADVTAKAGGHASAHPIASSRASIPPSHAQTGHA